MVLLTRLFKTGSMLAGCTSQGLVSSGFVIISVRVVFWWHADVALSESCVLWLILIGIYALTWYLVYSLLVNSLALKVVIWILWRLRLNFLYWLLHELLTNMHFLRSHVLSILLSWVKNVLLMVNLRLICVVMGCILLLLTHCLAVVLVLLRMVLSRV